MNVLIWVIAGAVALGVVAMIIYLLNSASSGGLSAPAPEPAGLRPTVADFHVSGDTATVFYDVPLPDGDIHGHLQDLLVHDAARVVAEKSAAGLPIEQVTRVRAMGKRDGEYVEIGVLDLREPGVIPDLAAPELVPHLSTTGYDPLADIGEQDFEVTIATRARAEEALEPFASDLDFPGRVEASLRALGIDPTSASLEDVTVGLLTMGGYAVSPVAGATQYLASKGGEQTLVEIRAYVPGQHPELAEQVVEQFAIAVAQRNPTRAMLITDMYGPYAIYERERRNPKTRYITRERLQTFVDGFALQS
jgi:hypothetical protein